jgi:anti-sigma B factor antagonist
MEAFESVPLEWWESSDEGGRPLFVATGDVDFTTVGRLGENLARWVLAYPDSDEMVIDLSGVTTIDSAGLRILVVAVRNARSVLVLREPSDVVRRLLEITDLLPLFVLE